MANEFIARNGLIAQNNSTVTGSLNVSGSINATAGITGSLSGSTTFASTASYLNTLNQNLTFNGNLTLNGTASVQYLIAVYETASTVLSTGSNQLGDATNDTQTLIGRTIVSGSLEVTGSTISTLGFTGSLQGTASWAESASQATTASYIVTAQTASYVETAQTASYVTTAQTASFVTTAQTASYVLTAQTASYVLQAVSASYAQINISAGVASNNMSALVFSNANNVSFGLNGSTVTATVDGGGTLSYYFPQEAAVRVAGQQGNGTLHMQPIEVPNITFDRIIVPLIHSIANNTSTAGYTMTYGVGIYSKNVSTLSLITSYGTTYDLGGGTIGTANSSLYGVIKLMSVPVAGGYLLTEGQYWAGHVIRTSTSGLANLTVSQLLASQANSVLSGMFGVANNATVQSALGLGYYSATTAGLPSAVQFNQLTGTATIGFRQPIFYFQSGTV